IREPSLCRCGSVFRVRRKIRGWIYVDDEGRAGRIDTKIDAGIAANPEQVPARQRKLLEHLGKFGLMVFEPETAQRTDIGWAIRRPFGVVAVDLGRMRLYPPKQDLGDGQQLNPRSPLKQANVEFASLDVGFGEVV